MLVAAGAMYIFFDSLNTESCLGMQQIYGDKDICVSTAAD